jgi:hypothetical protein
MAWWKALAVMVLVAPPAAYVAGSLSSQAEEAEPRPAVILPAGQRDQEPQVTIREEQVKQNRDDPESPDEVEDDDDDDTDDGVQVVRPTPPVVDHDGADDRNDTHDDTTGD